MNDNEIARKGFIDKCSHEWKSIAFIPTDKFKLGLRGKVMCVCDKCHAFTKTFKRKPTCFSGGMNFLNNTISA